VRNLVINLLVNGLSVDSWAWGAIGWPHRRWHVPHLGASDIAKRVRSTPFVERTLSRRQALGSAALALVLGVALIAEWQSRPEGQPAAPSRPGITQPTIDRLETEQTGLKKQIALLRGDLDTLQRKAAANRVTSSSLNQDLATQRVLAGTVPLVGSGIEILLDDSTARTLLPADSADNYIVHEYQIRDIVNLLWSSGASGISVNGERFVNSTSVYCVGSTILINDTRTSPPYRIVAVGNTEQMRSAFDDGNALRDLKGRVQAYGLVLQLSHVGSFTLPAYDGSIAMKHTVLAGGAIR
jgi:uncharacterized protein YlxW (UPF0749 family)